MKIIFAGTPPFAAAALKALLASKFDVGLVLTQPDRPAGRGLKLRLSAVKTVALEHDLSILQPQSLQLADIQQTLRNINADFLVVAAYGLILPQAVLDIPLSCCINIHASLLPRWRGAAPIQRALLAGDRETGISIMKMEAGLDTGPTFLMQSIPIDEYDNSASLHDKLADLGAQLIVKVIQNYPLALTSQDDSLSTYANKISKTELAINWDMPSKFIERKIRAFCPSPGSNTSLDGQSIKIYQANLANYDGPPGKIIVTKENELIVCCGQGALSIIELQKSGSKRVPVDQFLHSNNVIDKFFR